MIERRVEELGQRLESLSDPAGALAGLIEHTPTPFALYDIDGLCVRVNPAYRELFGDAPEPGSELADNSALGAGGALFWLRRAFSGEVITTPTFWCDRHGPTHPDARRRIAVSARAFPLRDRAGEIEFIAISVRDETDALLLEERRRIEVEAPRRLIDEIQRADLERRANEELFRAIFEGCADGVMITDDTGRVVDINPSGCRIFGRGREEIVGSPFWNHIGDVPMSRLYSEKLLEFGRLTTEVRVYRSDGALRDLELRAVAGFLPGRHLTTFLDVTERNEATRALQRSESHLVASQRIAHVGSWEFDLEEQTTSVRDRPLRASDECFRIFGVEQSAGLTAGDTLSFVHPEDREKLVTAMRHALETGGVYECEHRIVLADGEERVLHARGEAVKDPTTKQTIRVIGTTQDITDRARTRQEIQKLNEQLERRVVERTSQLETANRDLEAFAYSVSHDLRGPLRAINGYSSILLAEKTENNGTRTHALERIESAARRMDALIDGLLALSRVGRRETHMSVVAARPLVEEVLEELALGPNRPGIEIVLRDLPEVEADPALLRQVFVNLIGNAAKFSRENNPPRIEIGCRRINAEQVWYVRDNGIGFDMDEATQVFGMFERLRSAEEFEGTGVGLAIVERIVRRHGGRIWAESEPGRGATFFFTL